MREGSRPQIKIKFTMKVQDEFAKTLEAVTAWAKEKEACSSEYRKAKESKEDK